MNRALLASHCVALTLAADGSASTTQTVIPDGSFAAPDGRPGSQTAGKITAWTMNSANGAAVLAAAGALGRDIVVDYEHGTLLRAKRGEAAPAAGWIESPITSGALSYVPGKGIVATVAWTENAARMVAAREVRYLSPVFDFDGAGNVLALHSVALTNDPALGQLAVASLTARWAADGFASGVLDGWACRSAGRGHPDHRPNSLPAGEGIFTITKGDNTVNLAVALRAAFGMPETVTEESLLTHVAALKAAEPDPTKFVGVAVLTAEQTAHATTKAQLAALVAQTNTAALTAEIDAAKGKGAVLTAEYEAHVRKVGESMGLEHARAALAALPVSAVLAGQSQTAGRVPAGVGVASPEAQVAALTADQKTMAANLGVSAEDYAKELARHRSLGLQI